MDSNILLQIQNELKLINNKLDNSDARFENIENELEAIKRPVLIMEHELTRKVDILLETRVSANNTYERLDIEVGKLNTTAEIHTMQINHLKEKYST